MISSSRRAASRALVQRIDAGIENALQSGSVTRWNQDWQKQKRENRSANYHVFSLALNAELTKMKQATATIVAMKPLRE